MLQLENVNVFYGGIHALRSVSLTVNQGEVVTLIGSIMNGLLGSPRMHIRSPVGGGALSWFLDRSDGVTSAAGAISVSLWWYKAAMLAWALWLSFALLKWLRFAWTAIGFDGLWRGKARPAESAA